MCRSRTGMPTAGYALAQELQRKIARIPGAVDVHVHQVVDYPEIRVNVDRNKAGQVGLSQSDVANSLLISLSGTSQIAAAQWLNWDTGVQYQIGAQTPQRKIDSLDALMRTPIAPRGQVFDHRRRGGIGIRGRFAEPDDAGLRKSRRGRRRDAASVERRDHDPGCRAADRESLQRAAGFRRLCERRPAGSRLGRGGGTEDHG